jgi:NAD(P)-dependent dehydrogenase (short-subunit alcohol dehydrogenase family)
MSSPWRARLRGAGRSDVAPGVDVSGRVALVTGASAGLGERFARVLNDAGARVVVTARRALRLEALAADLTDPLVSVGDLTDASYRRDLIEEVRREHGRLDILVNNAGADDGGPLEDQDLDELTAIIDINLVAVMDICRLAAPLLFASKHASVINVASMYGLVASRSPMTAYNATKGAVVNLTRSLAAQWGSRGVRVNALAPAYFPSEMTGMLEDRAFVEWISKRTLLGRIPTLDELDGPLLFLASDASSYVTGHILVVDGGWTAV